MQTAAYFIEKFEAIDDSLWCTCRTAYRGGVHDALGHCGASDEVATIEAIALMVLFRKHGLSVWRVNDNLCGQFTGETPKARILAALQWVNTREFFLGKVG